MNLPPDSPRGTPVIDVQFDRPGRRYDAAAPLAVRCHVDGVDPDAVRAIELSVAWYTEGKGEEDLAVHAFERIVERDALRAALSDHAYETRLPPSPLTYEGVIVKIRWCVRVRIFFIGGRDYVSEHEFEMGRVPPARPPVIPEAAP